MPFSETHAFGCGLGLSIAQLSVALCGGTIQARNIPEGGLCVEIRLPLV
jgi:signal transduction histidine kinase